MLKRFNIIQLLIDRIGAETYLEIGVESGESFIPIRVKRKIAVDPQFVEFESWREKASDTADEVLFFDATSDEFFNHHSGFLKDFPIDVAFIDGLHTYEQSLTDVTNCLEWISSRGIVAMHDCSPSSETMATPAKSIAEAAQMNLPGWTGEWCGDVWKTIATLRSTRSDLHVIVLDCDYGVGLIRRGIPENSLAYSLKDIADMAYTDLVGNKARLLNLHPEEYLTSYLNQL